jgi:preprotein translocase subunit YajC
MEMIILYVAMVVPFMAVGFYAMYRENKEKRKEQMDAKNAALSGPAGAVTE